MEITWHGNTCFVFKNKDVKLVINPDKEAKNLTGEVVISSLGDDTAEVKEATKTFTLPGEYEIQGIPITAYRAWTKSRSKEEEEGRAGDPTIIFVFEIDEIKFCHLGTVGHILTSDMIKSIGEVDILMIDLGESSNLNKKKSTEILEEIEPRAIIPMGTGDLKKALNDLGIDSIQLEDSFKIKSRSELPDDKRLHVVLKNRSL